MSLSTLLFISLLAVCLLGSIIYHPFIGLLCYIATYCVNPLSHWWGIPIWQMGIRYSMFLALAVAIGMALNRSKLKFKRLFESQEKLLILFVFLLFISNLIIGKTTTDSNSLKLAKVLCIVLIASHVITTLKYYELMLWTFVITTCYLSFQAYSSPDWIVSGSRLDIGLGGSDFAESNFLGAHFAMLLPFIGILFLRSKWKGKVMCLISGLLVTNGIILTRSRGTFLALLIGGAAALLFAIFSKVMNKRKIVAFMLAGMIGFFLLADAYFWSRISTIKSNVSQLDSAATGRIAAWRAAIEMISGHPLGVGEGNFRRYAGQYSGGKVIYDVHNTYLRCATELGLQGFFVFLLIIFNAFRTLSYTLKKTESLVEKEQIELHIFAIRVALVIYLMAGVFISQIYIEELYWLLMFPVFLERSVQNVLDEP